MGFITEYCMMIGRLLGYNMTSRLVFTFESDHVLQTSVIVDSSTCEYDDLFATPISNIRRYVRYMYTTCILPTI